MPLHYSVAIGVKADSSIAGSLGIGKGSPDGLEELADDLKDHWTHNSHEGELKRFIRASI